MIQSLSVNKAAVCPPLANGNVPSGSKLVHSDDSTSNAYISLNA